MITWYDQQDDHVSFMHDVIDPPEINDINEPWPEDIDPERPF